jgi:8-oxo-dGTP diphosphatase
MSRHNAQAETILSQPKSSSQRQGNEVRSLRRKGSSRAGGTMTQVAPHIRVVAAIIEQQGRYLITQRRSMDVLAGLWEFPSGKVEAGETDEATLRRELRERAGVTADVGGVIAQRTHRSGSHVVDLVLYRATIASTKEPRALRVAELRWVAPQELGNYAFSLADQATTDLLLGTAHLDN